MSLRNCCCQESPWLHSNIFQLMVVKDETRLSRYWWSDLHGHVIPKQRPSLDAVSGKKIWLWVMYQEMTYKKILFFLSCLFRPKYVSGLFHPSFKFFWKQIAGICCWTCFWAKRVLGLSVAEHSGLHADEHSLWQPGSHLCLVRSHLWNVIPIILSN